MIFKANNSKNNLFKLLGALLFSSLCFIPFQSMQGMENFLFAALVSKIVFYEIKKFKISISCIFLTIVFSFLLRPEGILVGVYFLTSSIINRRRKSFLYSIFAILICFVIYKTLILITGTGSYNAGLNRSYTSRLTGMPIDLNYSNIFVSKKAFVALAYSLPLIISLIFNYKYLDRNALNAIGIFFILPSIMHIFLLFPDMHIRRYLLYSYSVLFIIFVKYSFPKFSDIAIFLLITYILTISFNEFIAKKNLPFYSVEDSVKTIMSDNFKRNISNELYEKFSKNSEKIIITTVEVQIRGVLDDRFEVWPLDGITDIKLRKYVNEKDIDHFSYLKERSINLLMNMPNYNIDKSIYSLNSIENELEEGKESVCYKNLKFIKNNFKSDYVNDKFYEVSSCEINYN